MHRAGQLCGRPTAWISTLVGEPENISHYFYKGDKKQEREQEGGKGLGLEP